MEQDDGVTSSMYDYLLHHKSCYISGREYVRLLFQYTFHTQDRRVFVLSNQKSRKKKLLGNEYSAYLVKRNLG